MNYCHKKLENFKKKNSYDKILEIGAGSAPHFKYLTHSFNEYHIAETSDYASEIFDKNLNDKIKFKKYDGKKLPYEDEYFDRIIISHCLEHILSPEEFIIEMMSKLKKGGVLSISLPTDPGVAWRLGRLFIRIFSIKKTYNITGEEYEYINATEHVNSIFNLISIIRYHYKGSIDEQFYPLKVKSPDLNLFYNVQIYK
jgi:SAM-dependent methyltransferase